MTRARFLTAAVVLLLAAGLVRGLWLNADPPTQSVGIVWHDEGAWVHNARNHALWGEWQTDNWNPVFIAPVFTALEAAAFSALGVGTWQARTVPAVSGLVAIALLMAGLAATSGRRAALLGGALLAFNYTWVMWNRAALMESTMTAFIVAAWAAYAMAARHPRWGFVAGTAATLAFFTKAAAAFFIAALVLDVVFTLASAWWSPRSTSDTTDESRGHLRAAAWTLAGLAASAAAVGLAFVLPHWADYQFYNWQMTVMRKPSYDLASLIDRATWLPVVQDIFMRMWPVLAVAAVAMGSVIARWRAARPADRLLVLWVLVGLLELTVHDSGTERRYVMFVPAFIALAAGLFARDRDHAAGPAPLPLGARMLLVPVAGLLLYVLLGSALRVLYLDDIAAGDFRAVVRLAAALAAAGAIALFAGWPRLGGWIAAGRLPAALVVGAAAATLAWDGVSYGRWAATRDDVNHRASVELGRLLPPGTLVHGKLANGLSLENQIRPVFVGRGFGNYDDRLDRHDVRYILTYVLPREGYESQPGLIREILDRYTESRAIATFDVDETPGPDRAALIEKRPGVSPEAVSGS